MTRSLAKRRRSLQYWRVRHRDGQGLHGCTVGKTARSFDLRLTYERQGLAMKHFWGTFYAQSHVRCEGLEPVNRHAGVHKFSAVVQPKKRKTLPAVLQASRLTLGKREEHQNETTLIFLTTLIATFGLIFGSAFAVDFNGLPNRIKTPGAINSAVTQSTIKKTICVQDGLRRSRPKPLYHRAENQTIEKWLFRWWQH